jgi:hypothetical protein
MGAASGLLATLLFVIAFIVFMGTSPGGATGLPNVNHAELFPDYLQANLSEIRIILLLNALGITLFLWFLASLWRTLRGQEDESSRGATAALVGGVAGSALILVGLALLATAGLSTSSGQAEVVPALYVASALMGALGMGVLSIFFFAVAKVIFETGALGRWLGVLAFITGLLAVCGFMTPFFEANVLNAATGALGHWAGTAAFVIWLGLASAVMTHAQRHRDDAEAAPAAPAPEPLQGGGAA